MAGICTSFFSSCLDGSSRFFCDEGNRCAKKVTDTGVYDKFLKCTNAFLEIGSEVSDSAKTVGEIGKTREFITLGRDALGILNVVNGAFPRTVGNFQSLYYFFANEPKPDDKAWEVTKNSYDKAKKAKDPDASIGEKIAFVIEQAFKALSNLDFIVAFGLSKPIDLIGRFFPDSVDPVAKEIGKAFPTIWFANHVTGVFGTGGAMAYQTFRYNRGKIEDNKYVLSMVENGLGFTAKVLEVVLGSFKLAKSALPAPARITLSAGAALAGLVGALVKD
jgi:hypothetical protein